MTKNANKAANKEVIVAAAVKAPAAEVIAVAVAAPTKADKAREIFKECYGMATVPARGDMIKRAVAEAGLTAKGAATYLQNYKAKNGLVTKKAAVATA